MPIASASFGGGKESKHRAAATISAARSFRAANLKELNAVIKWLEAVRNN